MGKAKKIFVCLLFAAALIVTGMPMPTFMSTTKVAQAASPVVEKAISWAVAIANDNSHGYSQSSRWGPDYDCSSFVISAFKNAGVNVGTATYTGNMRSQFTQHGFQWIPWSQIGGVSKLQRGDILLNDAYHTEIYLGNNQNVGAHSNRGYPQTGDQTGTEVSVSGYYYHPWNGVLRYSGSEVCNCSTGYAGDYYVATDSLPLTMRSGLGTNYSVVTSIPKGSRVYVSRANGSWAHVEWNGYSGYCSMSYLKKVAAKNYNLHVWVSETGMGNVPSSFVCGKRYYICYELIDTSTGRRANETSNINYRATETVRNSNGKIFEHTYQNSDNNWIYFTSDSEDTYTGTVSITGDINVSSSISFDAYNNTAPQIKVWAWESDSSKEISAINVGKTAYCSYLIRDKNTGKNLNDVTTLWIKDSGYTVTVKVYNPSGNLVKTQSYKNNDCTWFSFVPDKAGNYQIKTYVNGNLSGGYDWTIKAESPKPTVKPTAKPTIKPTVKPTAKPTVKPIVTPTAKPTVKLTATPTIKPTVTSTVKPVITPTEKQTPMPAYADEVQETTEKPMATPTGVYVSDDVWESTAEPTDASVFDDTWESTADPTDAGIFDDVWESTAEPTVADASEIGTDGSEDVTDYMECYSIIVFNSDGKEIWDTKNNRWTETVQYRSDAHELYLEKGTYYMEINGCEYFTFQPNKKYTGKYEIKTSFVSSDVNNVEGDNSFSSANNVVMGEKIVGQISLDDDYDTYKFELAAAGCVTLDIMSYMKYYRIKVFDSDGIEIWYTHHNEWTETVKYRSDTYNLYLEKGIYYMEIDGYYGGTSDKSTGKYVVSTKYTSSGVSFDGLNDNSFDTANSISLDKSYMGQNSINNDTDIYKLQLSSDTTFTVNMKSYMQYYYIKIYNSDGKQVWNTNTRERNKDVGYREDADDVTLSAGTYYVEINGNKSVGKYVFSLNETKVSGGK